MPHDSSLTSLLAGCPLSHVADVALSSIAIFIFVIFYISVNENEKDRSVKIILKEKPFG